MYVTIAHTHRERERERERERREREKRERERERERETVQRVSTDLPPPVLGVRERHGSPTLPLRRDIAVSEANTKGGKKRNRSQACACVFV